MYRAARMQCRERVGDRSFVWDIAFEESVSFGRRVAYARTLDRYTSEKIRWRDRDNVGGALIFVERRHEKMIYSNNGNEGLRIYEG